MKIEAEVECIENNEACLVIKVKDEFVEVMVPLQVLKAIKTDFEGARMYLVDSKKSPRWSKKNSKMEKVFKEIRKGIEKKYKE